MDIRAPLKPEMGKGTREPTGLTRSREFKYTNVQPGHKKSKIEIITVHVA